MSSSSSSSSLLHAATARAISGGGGAPTVRGGGNPIVRHREALRLAEACRLLLVEEDDYDGAGDGGGGILSRSLVMDAAISLASSSSGTDYCRGCRRSSSDANTVGGGLASSSCRCCAVALLIAGGRPTTKTRKRRRKEGGGSTGRQSPASIPGRIEFPMPCVVARRDGIRDDDYCEGDGGGRDDDMSTALERIGVRYVDSLSDVVGYLAYVTSLPDHLRPSRGIFILGIGEILPRRREGAGMELIHLRESIFRAFFFVFRLAPIMVGFSSSQRPFSDGPSHQVSVLSDTATALEERGGARTVKSTKVGVFEDRANRVEFSSGSNIAVLATIDKSSFSSIPPRVVNYFHHWMDAIAVIEPSMGEGRRGIVDDAGKGVNGSEWKLAFDGAIIMESGASYCGESSFAFRVNEIRNASDEQRGREPSREISWSV